MPIDWTPEQLEAEQAAMRARQHRGTLIDDLIGTVEDVLTTNGLEPVDEYERRTR
jgi:hypothetical protein